jgi:hypothetical protein
MSFVLVTVMVEAAAAPQASQQRTAAARTGRPRDGTRRSNAGFGDDRVFGLMEIPFTVSLSAREREERGSDSFDSGLGLGFGLGQGNRNVLTMKTAI